MGSGDSDPVLGFGFVNTWWSMSLTLLAIGFDRMAGATRARACARETLPARRCRSLMSSDHAAVAPS